MGIGIEDKHFFEKTYFFYKLHCPVRKLTGQFHIRFFLYRLQLVKILLHRAVLYDIIHILCRS